MGNPKTKEIEKVKKKKKKKKCNQHCLEIFV